MAQGKQEIVVHCEYAEQGAEIREILLTIFRDFLRENLQDSSGV